MRVRRAEGADAEHVRRLVAQALLAAGFGPPDADRDADLADFGYYQAPGRAVWVAEEHDGRIVGCLALDRLDTPTALLRRLAGDGLGALLDAAVEHARERGCAAVEAVLPPAMDGPRRAAAAAGFRPVSPGNDLLLRRDLDGDR